VPKSAASLWDPVDLAQSAAAPRSRQFGWVPGAIPVLVLLSAAGLAVLLPEDLGLPARLALFAFAGAAVLWTLTTINAAYVALGAVLLLVLGRAIEQEDLFETLESDVIWLMMGAFILGAAVQVSGLAARLTRLVAAHSCSVGGMMWLVTAMLVPLAFLMPSTSGRAAVSLPLFRSISSGAGNRRVTRALALLIPTIILVSTISSLVGAGSHLIANDLLDEFLDQTAGPDAGDQSGISFSDWMLYGLPFGIAASIVSALAVSRMFLRPEERRLPLRIPQSPAEPLSSQEKRTVAVATAMVVLWLTEGWHGLEIATVSILGAFILTLPGAGVLSWKAGLKAVSWNLIFFVGAALVLGEALIETGAAQWLIGRMFEITGITRGGSALLVLTGLTVISLTSHIYLTSHAARAAALIPPLLYLAGALDINAVAVMFIATVGMNYCLTFPVSSKALLMYQELERETWVPADLLRLSAVLLPVHAVLMVVFYYLYWRHVGLAL
jgi:anion transporter